MNTKSGTHQKSSQIFTYSTFTKKTDATPREVSETSPQFIKRLSTPTIRANKDGPLWSPAIFKKKRRLKENVIELSMLVLDIDGGMTIDQADKILRKLGALALICTTHSHQRTTSEHPKAQDCFRVVILLADPISADKHPRLWEWGNDLFKGKIDPGCKDASRMYYLPAIASKGAPFVFRNYVGAPLDWAALDLTEESDTDSFREELPLDLSADPEEIPDTYYETAIDGEKDRIRAAPVKGRNNAYNKAVYNLARLGIDRTTIEAELKQEAERIGLDKKEIQATFDSAFNAGQKKPRTIQPRVTNNGAGASSAGQTKQTAQAGNGANAQGAKQSSNTAGASSQKKQTKTQSGSTKRAGDYEMKPSGLIYRRQTVNGPVSIPLTNFCAEIVAEVIEDDGETQRRLLEIKVWQGNKDFQFLISVEDFLAMKWPMVYAGSKFITYPRQSEFARTAIQELSPQHPERRIHVHTGWMHIGGKPYYLHGGGAIGAQTIKDIEVRLPEALRLVELPEPPARDAWATAMRGVFELIGFSVDEVATPLAADEIMIPVIGAAPASVIGSVDFCIWLWGPTGAGKSQLAALMQSSFGAGFTADKLPESWLSTPNAIEANAHAAKDMAIVIDDFRPAGSAQDRARQFRDVDRTLRAQGNQHGRQRMSADTTLRKTKYPRGLIFSTAEEAPRGESVVARALMIEVSKTSIDFNQLSKFQRYASDGIFATAMSGYIRWLALHYEKIEGARREIERRRDEWAQRQIAGHRRCASMLGHLQYAWDLWIEAAQDAGALSNQDAKDLRERVLFALEIAGRKQDAHANVENPVRRFAELLQSAFASHRGHLESVNGGAPANAYAWGWKMVSQKVINPVSGKLEKLEQMTPCGERIGWHIGSEIYLLPDPAFALLERIAATGEGIGVRPASLWKALHEAGILIKRDASPTRRGYTTRRKIAGVMQNVLILNSGELSGYTKNDDNDDNEN